MNIHIMSISRTDAFHCMSNNLCYSMRYVLYKKSYPTTLMHESTNNSCYVVYDDYTLEDEIMNNDEL